MKVSSPLVLALASLAVGCGGGKSPDVLATTSAANACGLDTGYEGDGSCIRAPAPDEGIQLHFGPTSYDDPAALTGYVMAPGTEDVVCYNVPVPESDLFYMKQSNRMRPHSHHMRIFVRADMTSQPGPTTDCLSIGFGASGMIPGSQSPSWDSEVSAAPEDQGLARYLPKANMANFEIHYVNDTTTPILREGWVNLYKTPQAEITQYLNMIMMVGDFSINVPPHTVQDTPVTFTPPITSQTRLFDATAHMHAHSEQYTLSRNHAGQTEWEQMYQTFNWEEPLTNVFNSVVNNPTPDAATKRDGGLSGDFYLQPGDTLKWVCHVNNTMDTPIVFANKATTAEMCMLTGDFISSQPGLWNAFCGFGGVTAPGSCN